YGFLSCLLVAAATTGCTGKIAGNPTMPPPVGVEPPMPLPEGTDPGRIDIHRLNNLEYANTVRDLVGVTADISNFQNNDGKGDSFDNIASEFGVTDEQYAQYFTSAVDIA